MTREDLKEQLDFTSLPAEVTLVSGRVVVITESKKFLLTDDGSLLMVVQPNGRGISIAAYNIESVSPLKPAVPLA